jgi:hypothetical protein
MTKDPASTACGPWTTLSADRVGAASDERVDARLRERKEQVGRGRSLHLLPVAPLVVGIPTTAIAAVDVADPLRR